MTGKSTIAINTDEAELFYDYLNKDEEVKLAAAVQRGQPKLQLMLQIEESLARLKEDEVVANEEEPSDDE